MKGINNSTLSRCLSATMQILMEDRFAGYFMADIIVSAVIGLVTGLCVGPLLPLVGHWLSRKSVVTLLLQITVLAMAISSQSFPYSSSAPKRVAFHQTFVTSGIQDTNDELIT